MENPYLTRTDEPVAEGNPYLERGEDADLWPVAEQAVVPETPGMFDQAKQFVSEVEIPSMPGKQPALQPQPLLDVDQEMARPAVEGSVDSGTKDYWSEQAAMLVGGAEAAGWLATSMASLPVTGIAGLAGLLDGAVDKSAGNTESPLDRALRWMEKSQEYTVYQPQTAIGKQTMAIAMKPFEFIHDKCKN
jgi:hypothetical protein